MKATAYYWINVKRQICDSVLMGNAKLARKVSRLPLRAGHPERCYAGVTSLGQLEWREASRLGGTHLHGLISRSWYDEVTL